jgi:hypothetical protein
MESDVTIFEELERYRLIMRNMVVKLLFDVSDQVNCPTNLLPHLQVMPQFAASDSQDSRLECHSSIHVTDVLYELS